MGFDRNGSYFRWENFLVWFGFTELLQVGIPVNERFIGQPVDLLAARLSCTYYSKHRGTNNT